MRRTFITIYLFIVMTACGAADIPGTPVPADMLDGNRLLLKDFNLTVEAPRNDWKWIKTNSKSFVCRKSNQNFTVTSVPYAGNLDETAARKVLKGAVDAAQRNGQTVSDPVVAPSDKPIAGESYKIDYTLTFQGGRVVYVQQIVVRPGDGHIVLFGTFDEHKDTPEFKQFTDSIKVTK